MNLLVKSNWYASTRAPDGHQHGNQYVSKSSRNRCREHHHRRTVMTLLVNRTGTMCEYSCTCLQQL
eukprot:2219185-Pleurochrysis_carterae.AAC.2